MRNARILIAAIAVILLVVPAALAQVKPPQTAPVPKVEGMSLNDAQKALVSAGFNAVVIHENVTDPAKNNVVLKQQAPAGATLAKGSRVPVVVGRYTAPARVKVPYVTGKPVAEAQKILVENKLNAQVTMQPVAEPQRNGVVIGQKVAAGTPVEPGSMVPVIVGKYTPPARVNVPNVTGKPLVEAQKILAESKLNAQVTMQPVADPQRNGVVIAQKVIVGTPLAPGSPVPVVVGQYTPPAALPVPSVTGKPLAEAQKALAAAKLNAVVSLEMVTDKSKDSIVLKQQVAPGTALAPGSQVPLVVGKYTPPAAMPVPSVMGMNIDQARQALEKQGWKVEVMRMSQKDPRQNNVVLQQVPAAGARAVPQQTTVRLTIGYYVQPAAGGQPHDNRQNPHTPLNPPIEPDTITMPDTVGKSLADARNAVGSRGLSPARIVVHERTVSDPKLAAGVVRAQKPSAGAAVAYKSSSPIELWLDVYKKQP